MPTLTLAPRTAIARTAGVVDALETRLHAFAARHAITMLRLALGFVFVLFGVLKFFPNLSPAQGIAEDTTHKLFLGIFPDRVNLTVVAVVEVTAGLCLLSNRFVRAAAVLLLFEMAGILSPLVLVPGMLFGGPHNLPNLLGQYILKDVVLLASVFVLLGAQRGGRLVPGPAASALDPDAVAAARTPAAGPAPASPSHVAEHPRRRPRVSRRTMTTPRARPARVTPLLGPAAAGRRDRRLSASRG